MPVVSTAGAAEMVMGREEEGSCCSDSDGEEGRSPSLRSGGGVCVVRTDVRE